MTSARIFILWTCILQLIAARPQTLEYNPMRPTFFGNSGGSQLSQIIPPGKPWPAMAEDYATTETSNGTTITSESATETAVTLANRIQEELTTFIASTEEIPIEENIIEGSSTSTSTTSTVAPITTTSVEPEVSTILETMLFTSQPQSVVENRIPSIVAVEPLAVPQDSSTDVSTSTVSSSITEINAVSSTSTAPNVVINSDNSVIGTTPQVVVPILGTTEILNGEGAGCNCKDHVRHDIYITVEHINVPPKPYQGFRQQPVFAPFDFLGNKNQFDFNQLRFPFSFPHYAK